MVQVRKSAPWMRERGLVLLLLPRERSRARVERDGLNEVAAVAAAELIWWLTRPRELRSGDPWASVDPRGSPEHAHSLGFLAVLQPLELLATVLNFRNWEDYP